MNEDVQEQDGTDATVPPKLDLKKSVSEANPPVPAIPDAADTPEDDGEEAIPTIRLAAVDKPRTVLLKKEAVASKKETSRIPLEAAKAPLVEESRPKTIRIKPAVPVGTVGAAAAAPAAAPGEVVAGKRKTSRIPLEAAISGSTEERSEGKPKTIRLKRPAVGVKAPPTAKTVARSPGSLKKTAEIEVADRAGPSLTRRKTVRVKRPASRPSVKPAAIARPTEGGLAAVAVVPVIEDKPLWIFPTMAILGVIAAFVLVYVQMAQVFGPDMSLTRHSYGWRSLELSWPGKVAREF